MSAQKAAPTTSIAMHTNEDIYIRDKSLCRELIGKLSFTEMIVFQMLGRMPSAGETAMIDACLVTLMEHGLTPSALATRLIYSGAPEAMQAGVAAGLMGVGSVFVGTMEGNAELLLEITADPAGIEAAAKRIAQEHRAARKPLPGFGHHLRVLGLVVDDEHLGPHRAIGRVLGPVSLDVAAHAGIVRAAARGLPGTAVPGAGAPIESERCVPRLRPTPRRTPIETPATPFEAVGSISWASADPGCRASPASPSIVVRSSREPMPGPRRRSTPSRPRASRSWWARTARR